MPETAPYGSWRSPLTAATIVAGARRFIQVLLDEQALSWIEMRPEEGGRYALVSVGADGARRDLLPAGYSARTLVHEYGGGACARIGARFVFSRFEDQQLYLVGADAEPTPLTSRPGLRFADPVHDVGRERIVCVCEDHSGEGEARGSIVAVSLADGAVTELAAGADFYAGPRLSPDGTQLCWQQWNHPNMPWDGCELWLAALDADGQPSAPRRVAGGPRESIFQPAWSPSGALHFVSDATGFWNLYRLDGEAAVPLAPMQAEFGRPQWIFGMTTYGFRGDGSLICSYLQDGSWTLASLRDGALTPIPLPYEELSELRIAGDRAAFIGGSPTRRAEIVAFDLSRGACTVLRDAGPLTIEERYLSVPRPLAYPSARGEAHAHFYPPRNDDFAAPGDERPPLIVISHGGPTSFSSNTLRLGVQFWTSRGFAVLDVNYGGSTGYGRAYRERLRGSWGIVDVEDCQAGAQHLAGEGLVDPARMAIRGGSAGGYTTLRALTSTDTFAAGASHFGVSDLEALARDTHKFESRYLDGLIGPYPEARELYRERSPIHGCEGMSCPVIFLQGLEDKVVPPNQSQMMVDVLKEKGVPVAYLTFEGEQHGFRKSENQIRALEAELYFYARVFGFTPADAIEPVEIVGM